jgi:dipeptidyl aminopeptidase/acylaminoacyl peptidase
MHTFRIACRAISLICCLSSGECLADILPSLIDAETTSISQIDISADGKRLVWLADQDDAKHVKLRDVMGSETLQLPDVPGVRTVHWSADNRHVYVTVDAVGDEKEHLLVFDTAFPSHTPVDVTKIGGGKALLFDVSNPDGSALVGLNLSDPSSFDLYRVTPAGGKPVLVEKAGGGEVRWLIDTQGRLYGRIRQTPSGAQHIETGAPGVGRWQDFVFPGNVMIPGDGVVGVGNPRADRTAWFLGRGAVDVATLQRVALVDGAVQESVSGFSVDPDHVLVGPDSNPLLAQSVPDYPQLRVFDPALRRLLQGVPLPIHSVLRDVAYDSEMNRLVLPFISEVGEENIVLVDRRQSRASILFHHASFLVPGQAPRTQPVVITSRDNLTLHGYLTVPENRASARLPLVLLVHGGPWTRDSWDWDFNVIPLAYQGYAVLRVNYRGSSGYGRAFEAAGLGEWGGKMQDDLTDAVCWAVKQGIADPKKMIVMGGSYGGYAAIEALVRTPTLFAGAISLDGPVDLPAMIAESAPYAKRGLPIWQAYIGAKRDIQWDRSPLAHIDRIERPILAIQGVNDPRIRVSQLEKLERAMLAAGKPLKVLYLVDEGHGISRGATFVPYMRQVLEFISGRFTDPSLPDPDLQYCR